jgi:two-component system sensor histidine kinase CpxA
MKSRLFWKIFIPFWVLQTCIMFFMAYQVHSSFGPEHPWWVQPERRAMPVLARSAIWRYSTRGRDALHEQLQSIKLDQRSEYWLFDDKLNELSGMTLPEYAREAIGKALERGGIARSHYATFLAERATDAKGNNFVFAGEFLVPPVLHSFPGSFIFAILLSTCLTSLLCAGLAQYITRPIVRLRDAAHAISGGNLAARAGLMGSSRQDEIADLVRDFDTMAAEIEDLVRSNKRMLMGVSHDLRSPMARIRVALSLASTGPEAEREEMLRRIEIELLRLNGMIEQVLTVARLESGQFKAPTATLSLRSVLEEAVEDGRFEASQSQVEIVFDEQGPDPHVVGDANMLRSTVENLLRNAIFYAGEKGTVTVTLAATGVTATISVQDNGPGVPEDALDKLFDPFYRVDDARNTNTGGSGLGLSIVSGAVKFHNGTVRARNLQPHGLEVLIELPSSAAIPHPAWAK